MLHDAARTDSCASAAARICRGLQRQPGASQTGSATLCTYPHRRLERDRARYGCETLTLRLHTRRRTPRASLASSEWWVTRWCGGFRFDLLRWRELCASRRRAPHRLLPLLRHAVMHRAGFHVAPERRVAHRASARWRSTGTFRSMRPASLRCTQKPIAALAALRLACSTA
jgi:hypothetical protein